MGKELEIDYDIESIEVIVRWSERDRREFDKRNTILFDQIDLELRGREVECYFQKLSDSEHRLVVAILDGFLEFVLQEHGMSGTYQVKVQESKKTNFRSDFKRPTEAFLRESCSVRMIDLNAVGRENRGSDEFEQLVKRVNALKIASSIDIGNHQRIWKTYIDAQKAILKSLQQPYGIKWPPKIKKVENQKEEVKVKLRADIHRGLQELDEQLEKSGEYFFGTYSLADASMTPHLAALHRVSIEIGDETANLKAWMQRMSERPSFEASAR